MKVCEGLWFWRKIKLIKYYSFHRKVFLNSVFDDNGMDLACYVTGTPF